MPITALGVNILKISIPPTFQINGPMTICMSRGPGAIEWSGSKHQRVVIHHNLEAAVTHDIEIITRK